MVLTGFFPFFKLLGFWGFGDGDEDSKAAVDHAPGPGGQIP